MSTTAKLKFNSNKVRLFPKIFTIAVKMLIFILKVTMHKNKSEFREL